MNSAFLPSSFDIFEIYRRYCDITSGSPIKEYHQNCSHASQALVQLQTIIALNHQNNVFSLFDEIYKLMLRLECSEFPRFYDFVFFICRENSQISISISRAIIAWRLVLAGKFPLLNQWCEFLETNHRHNIAKDTWSQVLWFSRCVSYNLQGYDPEGAWLALIDEFVKHMYKINSSYLKRKYCDNSEKDQFEASVDQEYLNWKAMTISKKEKSNNYSQVDQYVEFPKLPCAVELCLSNSFVGMLSDRLCLQFN